jgi:hypothetical protein
MCPYPDCNRSSGKGFTRHENLKEHLRRLHRGGDGRSPELSNAESGETTSIPVSPQANHPPKRQRFTAPPLDEKKNDHNNNNHANSLDLQEEITKLRRETREKDSRLDELETIVKELRQMIKRN